MRIIGVGDNTVDRYLHRGMMYPGGNAVNVPVHAARLGCAASYLGWIADDPHGQLIQGALQAEGIDTSHCRLVTGENAYCEISLKEGDRLFGNYSSGVCDQIILDEADLNFIGLHNLTHTSIYSFIEPFIDQLHSVSQTLSFDFSQEWDEAYLERILPYIDIGLVSKPAGNPDEDAQFLEWAVSLGPKIVLMTSGEAGAQLFDGKIFYRQEPVMMENVVDTLGAGDAFAACFLVEFLQGEDIRTALSHAALFASKACIYFGAFGHGVPL